MKERVIDRVLFYTICLEKKRIIANSPLRLNVPGDLYIVGLLLTVSVIANA